MNYTSLSPCVIVMRVRCLVYWENDKGRQLSDRKEGGEVTFEIPLRTCSSLLL